MSQCQGMSLEWQLTAVLSGSAEQSPALFGTWQAGSLPHSSAKGSGEDIAQGLFPADDLDSSLLWRARKV